MSKTLLTAIQTEFLFFLALPLIPIRSYRVTIGEITEGYIYEERSHRYDKMKQPLHWRQIGEVYGFVVVFWSVLLSLGVQFVAHFPGWVANLIGKDPAGLMFLALLALLVFLIIWAYALSEMARFVIQKRRYRAVKEQIWGLVTNLSEL